MTTKKIFLFKYILHFFLIYLIVLFQVSFLTQFKNLFPLNLILSIIIFLFFIDQPLAIFWAIISGFFLDIFLPFPFGTFLIFFSLLILINNFIYRKISVHYPLYFLFLNGLVGILVYDLFFFLFFNFLRFLKLYSYFWSLSLNYALLKNIFWQVIINLIFLTILFFLFSKKIKKIYGQE